MINIKIEKFDYFNNSGFYRKNLKITKINRTKNPEYFYVNYENGEYEQLKKGTIIQFNSESKNTNNKFDDLELKLEQNYEKRYSKDGIVYFVFAKELNRVKIGFTGFKTVENRLCGLQTSSPCKLELIGYINSNQDFEKELHNRFDKYRIIGEWFKYSKEIKEYIQNQKISV